MNPINVVQSRFLITASNLAQCPPACAPEVAFVGRSNVGKSTLINRILQRQIAKSSTTPGKTKNANFFSTTWRIAPQETLSFGCIDLPGFGYAKVSKQVKREWEVFLSALLAQRPSIKLILHLIDSRHVNLELDQQVRAFLQHILRPDQSLERVFTKFDKLNKNAQHALYKSHNAPLISAQGALDSKFGTLLDLQRAIIKNLFAKSLDV
ncbi:MULTISPECIES: ribosome biogenesis GTP-binding protein YihA/YsxC [Helicobacter]|uniref:ribosome biogenesis GTP-binding protein YihA/YsxC n=1 Tax=Helicobacter TaxID=209 RepID=UPI000EAD1957|nr:MULTISPECIES: ribosome biogenesis GTP-binding protein YihA/YsxC [Helicobacter]